MKTYHLIGYDGAIRPGKATADQILSVLDGHETDRLATVSIDDDAIRAMPLTDAELGTLRAQVAERQAAELRIALDNVIAVRRAVEDLRGVSCHNSMLTIYLEEAPHAEDIVRDWAERNALIVKDESPPSDAKKWTRSMRVQFDKHAWSDIVCVRWPEQLLDGPSIVARDAELDGRPPEQVAAIRAEEMPF